MLGSLYSGASGVKSHSKSMTVTGSNIANVNTLGYKFNRVNFEDLMATSLEGDMGNRIGKGVSIGTVQNIQTQGSFEQTELETDVAIDGSGFFTVRDEAGNILYTRAGQFNYDKKGFLTTEDGKFLQVKDIDPESNRSIGNLKKINILDQIDPPKQTGNGLTEGTGISIKANMDSNAVPPEMPIDFENVTADMYNFSTSVNVIDNKGNEHAINIVFRKMKDQPEQSNPVTGQPIAGTEIKNAWQWLVLVPGDDLEGGTAGVNNAVGGGMMTFSNDGRLLTQTPAEIREPPVDPAALPGTLPGPPELIPLPRDAALPVSQVAIDFAGAGVTQTIGLNFGKESNPENPADLRSGLDGVTQFASDFNVHTINADGMKSGKIENIFIKTDGTIEGSFDSGNVKALGRMIISDFKAAEKLTQKGNNYYVESFESGEAIEDDPGKNGLGTVHSRSLEHSNVELSNEFVKMIEGQRAFQASAKTVTTSDEILADMIQMKR